MSESPAPATDSAKVTKKQRTPARPLSLNQRIAHLERAIHRHQSTLRFYENHPRLLRSAKHRRTSRAAVRRAHRGLARATRVLTVLEHEAARRDARRLARRLAKAPPKTAICHVFGRRYCHEAVAVAWCESRHSTTAQNGQYLGLFQMGSYERQMFGHGSTAVRQAAAAHKYFVLSGRDWSPWSCKPSYANYPS
jgi:Lysozyme like domain